MHMRFDSDTFSQTCTYMVPRIVRKLNLIRGRHYILHRRADSARVNARRQYPRWGAHFDEPFYALHCRTYGRHCQPSAKGWLRFDILTFNHHKLMHRILVYQCSSIKCMTRSVFYIATTCKYNTHLHRSSDTFVLRQLKWGSCNMAPLNELDF